MKRVAKVAIICDGKMLMGRRRDTGLLTEPGGHLEEGESPLEGALREVKEETGIILPVEPKPLRNEVVTKPDGVKIKVFTFLAKLKQKPATSMSSDPDVEVRRWTWVDLDKIPDDLHVPKKHNVILKGLFGDKAMKKTAFWTGFEKSAAMPGMVRTVGQWMANKAQKPLQGIKSFMAHPPEAVQNAAIKGVAMAQRNPRMAAAAPYAATGLAGAAVGRMTAPNQAQQAQR